MKNDVSIDQTIIMTSGTIYHIHNLTEPYIIYENKHDWARREHYPESKKMSNDFLESYKVISKAHFVLIGKRIYGETIDDILRRIEMFDRNDRVFKIIDGCLKLEHFLDIINPIVAEAVVDELQKRLINFDTFHELLEPSVPSFMGRTRIIENISTGKFHKIPPWIVQVILNDILKMDAKLVLTPKTE